MCAPCYISPAPSFLTHTCDASVPRALGGAGSRWFAPVRPPPLGFGLPEVPELSLDPSQQICTEVYRVVVLSGLCLHRYHMFGPHGNYQHVFIAHVQTGWLSLGD